MLRILVWGSALSLAIGLAQPAAAQQFTTQAAVLDICSQVAQLELDVDQENVLRGQCVGATQEFLVAAANVAPSQEALDQVIANLVVGLTEIMFTPACRVESEIALAISEASAASQDVEQQAQIYTISQTVRACDFIVTAAIFTPNIQRLGGDSDPSSTSASQN